MKAACNNKDNAVDNISSLRKITTQSNHQNIVVLGLGSWVLGLGSWSPGKRKQVYFYWHPWCQHAENCEVVIALLYSLKGLWIIFFCSIRKFCQFAILNGEITADDVLSAIGRGLLIRRVEVPAVFHLKRIHHFLRLNITLDFGNQLKTPREEHSKISTRHLTN